MARKLTNEAYSKLYNIKWLKEQYLINNRTLKSISIELGCSIMRISNILKENNVHVGKTKDPKVFIYLEDKAWLENEHHVKRNSIIAIAKNIGVGESVVRTYFKKYGIIVLHDIIKGRPFSEEHKQRISIGKKNYKFTANHLKNMNIAAGKRRGLPSATKGRPCPLERRLKISAKEKGTKTGSENPFYGKHHSDETRKLLSIIAKNRVTNPMKGKKHSPETRKKISDAAIKSEKRKAYFNDPTVRLQRSMQAKERYKNGYVIHGRGKWVVFEDGRKFYLKSSYEIRVANKLESLGIQWEYEPKVFGLGDTTYRPDFYLPEYDIWWEVKGWLNYYNKEKMYKFFKLYPEITLRMVWKEDMIHLESLSTGSDIYNIIMIGQDGLE